VSAKIQIAQVIEGFLRDRTGESLRDAQGLAAIDLMLLAAHLHNETGRGDEFFLQLAHGCLIEVQHGGKVKQ
jgi:hypothetical protein